MYQYQMGIGRYEKSMLVFYRYWPLRKLNLSVHISIGQYEKQLIGRTHHSIIVQILIRANLKIMIYCCTKA